MDLIEQLDGNIDKDEMLAIIKARVTELLSQEPGLLMSYLYRLDVLEYKIKAILAKNSTVDPVDGFSELILERQLERMETKLKYKQDPIEGMEW